MFRQKVLSDSENGVEQNLQRDSLSLMICNCQYNIDAIAHKIKYIECNLVRAQDTLRTPLFQVETYFSTLKHELKLC